MNYGMYDDTPLDNTELCDQCRALIYAITKCTNHLARDTLTAVLKERIEWLSLCFDDEFVSDFIKCNLS